MENVAIRSFRNVFCVECGQKTIRFWATGCSVISSENFQSITSAYSRQAELRMILQKLARLNFGSSSASTSSFTVPKVVSGLW
jgi:hypothetical protein